MKENILIFYETSITLTLNPKKDCTKRENCNPTWLINIDAQVSDISKKNPKTHLKKYKTTK